MMMKHPNSGPPWTEAQPIELKTLLRIRNDTAMPLHQQLERQIIELVKSGRLPPGATLPAERYLAETLGVSRGTVQRCYSALREMGIIVSDGRRGSTVQENAKRIAPGMDRLKGFTEEMKGLGRTPSTKILEKRIGKDPVAAAHFASEAHVPFLKLRRVRSGDDVPLSIETAWYNLELAPFLSSSDLTASIYAQLADNDVPLAYCEQTIETVYSNKRDGAIFGFPIPQPCLLLKRKSYSRNHLMVEYVEGLFRGDTFTYRMKLYA